MVVDLLVVLAGGRARWPWMTEHTGQGGTPGAEDKLARIGEPHVRVLNRMVEEWRQGPDGPRVVPWFDPDGGGVRARVLVLMETPGPQTVRAGRAGFSSEDNDDPTAAALRRARSGAGLARLDYLRWNVVPWPLHDSAGRRRAPLVADLDEARPALRAVFDVLGRLELVVAVGAPALSGVMRLLTLDRVVPLVQVLGVPHPSPRNARLRAESITRLENALARGVR